MVELPPMPELEPEPVDGAVGLVVLDEPPMPEPDAPEPALLRWSRRQSSRCEPVSPTHLLASLPDAPDDAPVVPDVLLPEVLLLSVEPELDDDAPLEGRVVLLPDDELPVEGVAEGGVALPEDELPLDGEVVLLWANAAPDRARSAAAVAAVSVFNII